MDKITADSELSKSKDLVAENIEKLKALFPEIGAEGKIDFKVLQQILGEEIEEEDEYYRFTWAGKSMARREAHKPSTGTLRPAKEESVNWDTTQNLYIEGDNLEVLKLLQKSYAGKVKMIYIDPPYNTGKDFVYKDNYKDNLKNYQEVTGQIDERGNKLSTNSENDGRFHSNWLNMMYPRLKLARNLLKEDGAILMSIDDNEVDNLRKLGNEVFGENNFISNIVWQKKYAASNDAKYLSDTHDHILLFAKNREVWKPNMFPRPKELNDKYKNPDNDPRGPWYSTNLSVKTYSSKNDYVITSPAGIDFSPPPSRCWVVSKEKYEELLADNRIWFGKDGTSRPYQKKFLSEVQDGIVPTTLWKHEDAGHNIGAKSEVRDIFSEYKGLFDTPKPTRLLERIITLTKSDSDDIFLDFFAGSSTTGHAIFQDNLKNRSNNKFILVQLPEPISEKDEAYKAGFHKITDIGKERLKRVARKITEDNPNDVKKIDLGFKVFKLDSSNITPWDGSPDNLEDNLFNSQDNIKEGRSSVDVLYEILLKYGLELTTRIEQKTFGEQLVYSIGAGRIFICLDKVIKADVAESIGQWKEELDPELCRVVFRDSGLTDVDKTNATQTLKKFGITEVKSI